MVLSWDFEFLNEQGEKQVTRTSQDLLAEVSYPVPMHDKIEAGIRKKDTTIQNLFVKQTAKPAFATPAPALSSGSSSYEDSDDSFDTNYTTGSLFDDYDTSDEPNYNLADTPDADPTGRKISTIRSLKNGYGFINYPPNNLFFHYTSLIDTDFEELNIDDEIEFTVGQNPEGKDIAVDVRLLRS
jgi:cold shock CspA family protein